MPNNHGKDHHDRTRSRRFSPARNTSSNRTDVQNIDMMNLAGFCRNCMSRWYREAANESGVDMDENAARTIIYGMDYAYWKDKFQTEASAEQKAKYNKLHPYKL